MLRVLAQALAFLLLAVSGVVHGLWTGRWGPSAALEAAARCDRVAMTLGDWEGQATVLPPRHLAVAEIAGYVSRRYVNRGTGQTVSVLLVCGRPGPIAVHAPTVCFEGSGYHMLDNEEKYTLQPSTDSGPANFRTVRFQKPGVAPETLRIFWSWRGRGAWMVPDKPRLTFARSGFLYKLYVVHRLSSADDPLEEDPALDFLRLLLPELQRCLSPISDQA